MDLVLLVLMCGCFGISAWMYAQYRSLDRRYRLVIDAVGKSGCKDRVMECICLDWGSTEVQRVGQAIEPYHERVPFGFLQ